MKIIEEIVDGRIIYKKSRSWLDEKVLLLGILVMLIVMDVFLGIQILSKL